MPSHRTPRETLTKNRPSAGLFNDAKVEKAMKIFKHCIAATTTFEVPVTDPERAPDLRFQLDDPSVAEVSRRVGQYKCGFLAKWVDPVDKRRTSGRLMHGWFFVSEEGQTAYLRQRLPNTAQVSQEITAEAAAQVENAQEITAEAAAQVENQAHRPSSPPIHAPSHDERPAEPNGEDSTGREIDLGFIAISRLDDILTRVHALSDSKDRQALRRGVKDAEHAIMALRKRAVSSATVLIASTQESDGEDEV
ncbi:hypothetical protein HMN09_00119000 [Mycena chlorophos]|uniref:Uncharacterized protein n=1 Tax=Mycena chlorophos TaxID=658473 RepID=A0A8H6TVB1_MYCCL|nr:hypothetical protein HMN09_00119000 [Mycena chlorophos]